MNDNQSIPPLNARQFLKACTKIFGTSFMLNLFKISERHFAMWRADSRYVVKESVRTNYIEKHEELLQLLIEEPDGEFIARSIVSKHANVVGCEIFVKNQVIPDKNSIEEECLDDYPPITKFHSAIRENKDPAVVEFLGDEARKEIDETVQKYKLDTESKYSKE